MNVEMILCWTDGTWSTEVIQIDRGVYKTPEFKEYCVEVMEGFLDARRGNGVRQEAAYIGVYHYGETEDQTP